MRIQMISFTQDGNSFTCLHPPKVGESFPAWQADYKKAMAAALEKLAADLRKSAGSFQTEFDDMV